MAVDEFIQPIINLYQKIEYELLLEVAKRFDGYDEVTGTLEWQLKKLQELGALNQQALNIFEQYSEKSEKEIKRMLEQAGLMNLDIEVMQEAFEQGVLTIDPTEIMQSQAIKSTIEQSYKSINQTFRMIKTKALESTRQAYINPIWKPQAVCMTVKLPLGEQFKHWLQTAFKVRLISEAISM